VRELADSGTTLLLTTQYLEEADQLARRIAVIDGCAVIAEGTPDQLKSSVGGEHLDFAVKVGAELPSRAREISAQHSSAFSGLSDRRP
jgi:ABC-2 type transport system ATP-binding protein